MGIIAQRQPRAIRTGNPIVFPGHVHRERRVRIHAQLKPDVEPCNVLAGVGLALAVTLGPPPSAVAEPATPPTQMADEIQQGGITPVYFGNGCFWGRQKDFVDTERNMGRVGKDVSAVVGYAGGKREVSNGKVCYYFSLPDTVYEKLGHAEVVQVDLMGAGGEKVEQMKMFANTYFSQFKKTSDGMMRLDPMDTGAGYRNVVGIPGGVSGPYMSILREANVNGMELREGKGNEYVRGRATEPDQVNVVYIVDSSSMGFHLAEKWHQFHNGVGKAFPEEYTRQQKNLAIQAGRIGSTGCPEYPFL